MSRRRPPGPGSDPGPVSGPPALSRLAGRVTGWLGTVFGGSRETLLAGIGVSGLSLAALVVFVPWLFPDGVLSVLGDGLLANRGAVVLLAVAGVLYAAVTVVPTGESDDGTDTDDEWFDEVTPTAASWNRSVAGEDIDVTLASETDDRAETVAWRRRYNRREARRRLRAAVVDTLVEARRIDRSEAERLVNTGQWTDSQRAGAFLSGVPGRGSDGVSPPTLPLGTRVRDWLTGEGFDRNVEATVAELVALRDVRGDSRPATASDVGADSASATPTENPEVAR